MSDRKQLVALTTTCSLVGYLKAAVSKGYVLDPLGFFYLNDNQESFTRLFAADTSLLYKSDCKQTIDNTVNTDLSKINANTTKLMFISNHISGGDINILFYFKIIFLNFIMNISTLKLL